MDPTTKPIADFHRQVIAHVGRTKKQTDWNPVGFVICSTKRYRQTKLIGLASPHLLTKNILFRKNDPHNY